MKKKALLTAAILIPVLMIVITALGVLLTTRNMMPTQKFLYSVAEVNNPYYCNAQIKHMLIPSLPAPRTFPNIYRPPCPPVKFYVYDFKTGSSVEVSLEQAQHFSNPNKDVSADGFIIGNFCAGKMFALSARDYQDYFSSFCLIKGGYKRKFNPHPNNDAQRNSYVNFITWLQGDNK